MTGHVSLGVSDKKGALLRLLILLAYHVLLVQDG